MTERQVFYYRPRLQFWSIHPKSKKGRVCTYYEELQMWVTWDRFGTRMTSAQKAVMGDVGWEAGPPPLELEHGPMARCRTERTWKDDFIDRKEEWKFTGREFVVVTVRQLGLVYPRYVRVTLGEKIPNQVVQPHLFKEPHALIEWDCN